MPPRRSCFPNVAEEYSRIPSCFNATTAFLLLVESVILAIAALGFNATTAFLLQSVLQSPRPGWACFNATTAFLLRRHCRFRRGAGITFQCHHGVPASLRSFRRIISTRISFNATTAFLLPGGIVPDDGDRLRFQCHHGVPASQSEAPLFRHPLPFQCHHGVPASRRRMGGFGALGEICFNATTAFLLL